MNSLLRMHNLPLLMILAIYLPAAVLGFFAFGNRYAEHFLIILLVFSVLYFFGFQWLALAANKARLFLHQFRLIYRFRFDLFLAVFLVVYFAVTLYAALTAEAVPLFVALSGGTEMNIADARAGFLSGREGFESIIRYLSFIVSRSIAPIVIVYLFYYRHALRFIFAGILLFCYFLSLEKVVPIFAFLPLVFLYVTSKRYVQAFVTITFVALLVVTLSWVSYGGMAEDRALSSSGGEEQSGPAVQFPDDVLIKGPVENPERLYLKCVVLNVFYSEENIDCFEFSQSLGLILLDRVVWVPYITAYDWLAFQDVALNGKLTMGRSMSFVHRFFGEPKMQLEKMIYAYQRGPSPGGAGTANTLFLVDSKLVFGWGGVILYSLIFTFCAASIFSSSSRVLKLASINPFLVAAVSPLTATLLSGGLAIFVVLAFLLPPDDISVKESNPAA